MVSCATQRSAGTALDAGAPMVALRKLPGRSLLSVTGSDARALLRGVLTCDVDRLAGGDSSPAEVNRVEYGALLNSAGRVLYDVFLHGGTKEVEKEAGMGGVIVECSANAVDSLADALRCGAHCERESAGRRVWLRIARR